MPGGWSSKARAGGGAQEHTQRWEAAPPPPPCSTLLPADTRQVIEPCGRARPPLLAAAASGSLLPSGLPSSLPLAGRQVIEPRVRAYLYTWGEGRLTAEGERIPGGCWLHAAVAGAGGGGGGRGWGCRHT